MVRAGSIPKRAGEEDEEEQSWLHPKKELGKGRGMSRASSIPKRAGKGKGDEEKDGQYWLHHKKGWERGG